MHRLVHRAAIAIAFRDSDQIERRLVHQLAFVGYGNRDRYGAGKTQPSPVRDGAGVGFDQQHSVLVDPSGRNLIDRANLRRKLDQIAIAALHDLADTAASREQGVLVQVQSFENRVGRALCPRQLWRQLRSWFR